MKKETVYYVEYLHFGLLFSETSRKKISDPDPKKVKQVDGAYGFRIIKQEQVLDGSGVFKGSQKYLPGEYYFNGAVYTLNQVKDQFPDEKILISNMECNNYKKVIKCGHRFFPFDKNCKLVEEL